MFTDPWFLEVSSPFWSLGNHHHKSDCWYFEIYGGLVSFWSWIHHVGDGNKSTIQAKHGSYERRGDYGKIARPGAGVV